MVMVVLLSRLGEVEVGSGERQRKEDLWGVRVYGYLK
jgi:hypothetical protein